MKESTSRRRVSRRMAIASVALMSVAAPAAASVIIQNFIVANVSNKAACFTKIAGSDSLVTAYGSAAALASAGPYAAVNTTNTLTSTAGVTLLNEKVDIRGFAGDRTRYTDIIRYKNTCSVPITVSLKAEADAAGSAIASQTAPAAAAWSGMSVKAYMSKVAAPVASTALETDAVNWDQQFTISSTGAVVNGSNTVTVASGSELQGAFIVDVDSSAAATIVNTFHYTASASA